jgi:hypothetical protein
MRNQFQRKRKNPCIAIDHELSLGQDIAWTLRAKRRRSGSRLTGSAPAGSWRWSPKAPGMANPFGPPNEFRFIQRNAQCDPSLRTSPQSLRLLVRGRWSLEGWQQNRDTQRDEDTHRYRGYGAGALASLRTATLDLLRLHEFRSTPLSRRRRPADTLNQPGTLPGLSAEDCRDIWTVRWMIAGTAGALA